MGHLRCARAVSGAGRRNRCGNGTAARQWTAVGRAQGASSACGGARPGAAARDVAVASADLPAGRARLTVGCRTSACARRADGCPAPAPGPAEAGRRRPGEARHAAEALDDHGDRLVVLGERRPGERRLELDEVAGRAWRIRGLSTGRGMSAAEPTPMIVFDSMLSSIRSEMRKLVLARMFSLTEPDGRWVARIRWTPRLRLAGRYPPCRRRSRGPP